jgi:hypothetical protein
MPTVGIRIRNPSNPVTVKQRLRTSTTGIGLPNSWYCTVC